MRLEKTENHDYYNITAKKDYIFFILRNYVSEFMKAVYHAIIFVYLMFSIFLDL